jgi:hypothetical protein
MTFFMLRGPLRDEGETTTRSLRSITEEDLAPVGDLLAANDEIVAHAGNGELKCRDVA